MESQYEIKCYMSEVHGTLTLILLSIQSVLSTCSSGRRAQTTAAILVFWETVWYNYIGCSTNTAFPFHNIYSRRTLYRYVDAYRAKRNICSFISISK